MNVENKKSTDLYELVEIAEKSYASSKLYSEKINTYKSLIVISLAIIIILSVIFYFNFYKFNQLYLMGGASFLSLTFILLFLNLYRQLRKYQAELNIETEILHRLIEMIYEIKDVNKFRMNLTMMELAIIEMRLQRIKFSTKYRNNIYSDKRYNDNVSS